MGESEMSDFTIQPIGCIRKSSHTATSDSGANFGSALEGPCSFNILQLAHPHGQRTTQRMQSYMFV